LQTAGSGTHGYQYVLTGLVSATTYHYRAAASNSLGVVFGTNVSFTTPILAFSLATNLTALHMGRSAWGDYDNDGLMDLTLCGVWETFSESASTFYRHKTEFWRNAGTSFTRLQPDDPIPAASIAWGDADNDGWLDALVYAVHIISPPDGIAMARWLSVVPTPADPSPRNVGISGDFGSGDLTWGDFNNDGRLDATAGVLFLNTGQSLLTNGLAGSAGADFDNDGRLDLARGRGNNSLWRNTGPGFADINAGLPNVFPAAFSWGDYDNDGRIDFLLTGNLSNGPVSQIWRNTGSGFTNIQAGLTGFTGGSAAWGDYDNDGRLDLLMTGQTNSFGLPGATELWRNAESGFQKVDLAPPLPPVRDSHVAWGDFDNDGRLDIFVQGRTNLSDTNAVAQIWRNRTPLSNTPPSAPTGLSASIINNEIVFTWNSATDGQTPAPGLTYNMRAGTTPGGIDLVSPLSAANGFRRLPASGNRGHARVWVLPLANLPLGTSVYWSIQSVDTAFAGSPFSAEHSFRVLQATPPPPNPPLLLPVTTTNVAHGDLNGDGIIDQSEINAALAPILQNSPFLEITNSVGLGSSHIVFSLSNATAGAFSVESSTNLQDWNFLGPALPRYEFVDTNTPAGPQRYYRLRWP
jgi:hypothetical protein